MLLNNDPTTGPSSPTASVPLVVIRPGRRRPAILRNGLFRFLVLSTTASALTLGHRARVLAHSVFTIIESIRTSVVPTCRICPLLLSAHPVHTREASRIASPMLGNTERKESPTWCRGDVWAWGPSKEGTFLSVIPSEKLASLLPSYRSGSHRWVITDPQLLPWKHLTKPWMKRFIYKKKFNQNLGS